jgi:type IV pilus biogenesis protein CpaD/CtpE
LFGNKRQRTGRRALLAGSILVAVTLLLTGCGTASPATPNTRPGTTRHHHPAVSGTVGSIGNGSFQLNTAGGSTKTVLTGSKTRYLEGKQKVSASTLQAGQHVRVRGKKATGSGLIARVVRIIPGKG